VPDEAAVKKLALEHCWRINDRDIPGLLKLYAPTINFEDPVGSGMRAGHAELRAHAAAAIASGVTEIPGTAVGTMDGAQAALPVTGLLPYVPGSPLLAALRLSGAPADPAGKVLRVDYVMVIKVGTSGLIEQMRSYWGASDVRVVDRSSLPQETLPQETLPRETVPRYTVPRQIMSPENRHAG
jgi:steroid delta-isomerase